MSAAVAWRRTVPAVVGVLLVMCAALVGIGVAIEHGGAPHADNGVVESTGHAEGGPGESGEQVPHAEGGETAAVLGVPLESPAALMGFAVVSLGLALLVWRRPSRPVADGVLVFTVAAGVLDAVEIGRHLSADRTGLAVLAGLIVVLRVVTAAGAVEVWRGATAATPSRSAR